MKKKTELMGIMCTHLMHRHLIGILFSWPNLEIPDLGLYTAMCCSLRHVFSLSVLSDEDEGLEIGSFALIFFVAICFDHHHHLCHLSFGLNFVGVGYMNPSSSSIQLCLIMSCI